MRIKPLLLLSSLLLLSASCRTEKLRVETLPRTGTIPRAVIYRTNINVNDNVPITVSADGLRILSFPGPGDVGTFSTPIELADGWLLDRRGGIGQNTLFLTYTYSEYSELREAPAIQILLEHIIPQAKVTDTYRLDVTVQEALSDTASINNLIRKGSFGPPRITVDL